MYGKKKMHVYLANATQKIKEEQENILSNKHVLRIFLVKIREPIQAKKS
jgi:hypothetical protein